MIQCAQMHSYQATPVIGLPKFDGWSQVVTNPLDSFVCAFSVSGADAGNVGRDIVNLLTSHSPKNFSQFHDLIQLVVDLTNQKDCSLQLSSILFDQDCALITFNGRIFLKRNEKVGKILASENELKIVQGKFFAEDDFILTTLQTEVLWGEINQKFSKGFDIDTIITSIIPGLHTQKDSSLSALAFIHVGNESYHDLFSDEEINQSDIDDAEGEDISLQSEKEIVAQVRPPIASKNVFKQINLAKVKVIFNQIKQLFLKVKKNDFSKLNNKKNKIKLIAVLVTLILLIISGFLWRSRIAKQKKEAEQMSAPLLNQLQQTQSLVGENPIAAREQTQSVIDQLSSLSDQFSDRKAGKKIVDLALVEAQTYYDQISGQQEFDQLATFFDLRLVKADFIASDVKITDDTLVFLDGEIDQLIKLNPSNKQSGRISLPSEQNYRDLAVGDESVYLLTGSVYQGDINGDELAQIIQTDDKLAQAKFINVYDENVYILNPDQRNIYRYSYSDEDEGYGDPTSWLRSFEGIDLSIISSMSIDGDIWLADNNGQVYRLRSGKSEQFQINGMPDPFENQLVLSTTLEGDFLYILESAKSRIVVLNKNGDFYREFKSSTLSAATDLVVSEDEKSIFIVSGSLVFKIDLASDI